MATITKIQTKVSDVQTELQVSVKKILNLQLEHTIHSSGVDGSITSPTKKRQKPENNENEMINTEQASHPLTDQNTTSSQQVDAWNKLSIMKGKPKFDASVGKLSGVSLANVLQMYHEYELQNENFTSTSDASNKSKIRRIVKNTYSIIGSDLRAKLTCKAPNQLNEPDNYSAWQHNLRVTADTAQRAMMDYLDAKEKDIESNKFKTPLEGPCSSKPKRSVLNKSNGIMALEKRWQECVKGEAENNNPK